MVAWENIVGLTEIAERLDVNQNTPDVWRSRGVLPPPEAIVSGTPLWDWTTIEEWARATGRLH